MRLAIVGHGRMGRRIEQLAVEAGWTIHARIGSGAEIGSAAGADVAVEFTNPASAPVNVAALAALRLPVVVGTTGWLEQFASVEAAVTAAGSAMVWSANYSIGVQLFSRVVRDAAHLLAAHPQYGAWGWEIHHDTKRDAPSGTLIALVDAMRGAGYGAAIDVSSNRAGAHPGTHEIGFDSSDDTITLRHTARSRDGFARGALMAAHWIAGRTGIFTFGDVLFGPRAALTT
jgi:4-hydroxy-tetrahydrodipicolinate reductase